MSIATIITDGLGSFSRPSALLKGGFSSYIKLPEPPATGKQYSEFTSIDADTIYAGITSPSVAVGDIRVVDTTVSPSGNVLTAQADGNDIFTWDGSRQYYVGQVYDVSALDFMAVTGGGTTFTVWFGNQAPTLEDPQAVQVRFYPLNIAITPEDLSPLAIDADDATLDVAAQDTWATGLSEAANTLSGTPTVRGIVDTTVRWTDIAGAYVEANLRQVIGDVDVPDVDDAGTTLEEAIAAIQAVYLVASYSTGYSDTVPAGEIMSQDPAAGTDVAPNSTVTLVVSGGAGGGTNTYHISTRMGLGI